MRPVLPLLVLSACLPRIDDKADGCPAIGVEPASLSWSDVRLGSAGEAVVVVANACDGEGTLDVTAAVDGAVFGLDGTSWSLAPGESVEVEVTYTPDDAAADVGTLTFDSNDGVHPTVTVTLDGTPIVDGDGDGYYADDDCDDTSADAYPGGTETWYDGIDGDCSGGSDYDQDGDGADAVAYGGSDCEDMDAEINTDAVEQWYDGVDQDCSGGSDYDQDGDGQDTTTSGGDDCNDTEAGIYAGAEEIWYDNIDEDCAGGDDFDQDGDGHAALEYGGTDCDDTRADVYPSAEEVWYDGVDQDCAGDDDYDRDGDGDAALEHGGGDCQDEVAGISSLATETWYDGIDQDCAGDDDYDQDHDGYVITDDCDDTDATWHPGAADAWYDGADQDCLGNDDYDQDGDGDPATAYGGGDCADTIAAISSLVPETWYDGIDGDCAGGDDYDQDGDGHAASAYGGDDCDDLSPAAYTGAAEVWYDGIDEDCLGGDDYDQDADGYPVYPMGTDCDDTDPARIGGTTEVRNGVDDDCDGQVDEGVSAFGDLVVTEIMVNPTRVGDTLGEWVEIYNPGAWDVDLSGWRLAGSDGNTVTVSGSLVVPAGGYTVLGVDADTGRNGGAPVDYAYATAAFALADAVDTVLLYAPEGTLIASVSYSGGWPLVAGAALSLDPYFLDAASATLPASWCAATTVYGMGDHGTPGGLNEVCTSVDHDLDGELISEGDCDDFDASVYTGATEVTDGVDQDCDGIADEIPAPTAGVPYVDGTASYWNLTVNGFADAERDGIVEMFYVSLNNDYLYTAPVTGWTGWAGRHDLYGTQEIPALTTSLVGCCTYTTEVVDLTGDGDADYVVGGYGASGTATLNLFRGVIAGHSSGGDYDVTIGSSNATGGYPQPYVGADFNGDGVSELVVASPTSPWSSHTLAGYVGIYDLNGLRTNAVARDDADRLYYGDANNQAVGTDVAAADWNGDGYADLALSGNASIWLVQGDGLATTGSAALPTAATAAIDWAGATTIQVALADDLGDGTRSLVGAADDLRRWVDAGALTGASSADAADTLLTGPAGWAPVLGAAAADVDGDSIDDLLFSADADRRTMLYGYAAADWPAGTHPIGAGALGWELAEAGATWGSAYDLDGDGAEEVVLSHPGYSSVGRTWIVGF